MIPSRWIFAGALVMTSATALVVHAERQRSFKNLFDASIRYTDEIEFPPRIGDLGNPVSGQANFGIGSDGVSQDPSQALFEGFSLVAGDVVSNGRTCATCHRPEEQLGLPPPPLSDTIPLDDVLFTGLEADIGEEPLGEQVFDQLGLLFHRPNRLNPLFPADSPLRQVFFWRKTQPLLNVVFTFGLLNDGRSRELVETSRGAVFTHTQNGDLRFDDLVDRQRLLDISRFMEEQIDPPELRALLDPEDPNHQRLVEDPFATVPIRTHLERQGSRVFEKNCMGCHNMPNVFSNRTHRKFVPTDSPPPYGRSFDIGVSQRNAHDLEFRRYDPSTGTRVPIVLPLAKQDGSTVHVTVVDDIGLAATTGRYEDLHKFKVPQLRRISELGPYFHDNSADTLEEVVDYFNSEDYNRSSDGRQYPIRLSPHQREALLAFLRIL